MLASQKAVLCLRQSGSDKKGIARFSPGGRKSGNSKTEDTLLPQACRAHKPPATTEVLADENLSLDMMTLNQDRFYYITVPTSSLHWSDERNRDVKTPDAPGILSGQKLPLPLGAPVYAQDGPDRHLPRPTVNIPLATLQNTISASAASPTTVGSGSAASAAICGDMAQAIHPTRSLL